MNHTFRTIGECVYVAHFMQTVSENISLTFSLRFRIIYILNSSALVCLYIGRFCDTFSSINYASKKVTSNICVTVEIVTKKGGGVRSQRTSELVSPLTVNSDFCDTWTTD